MISASTNSQYLMVVTHNFRDSHHPNVSDLKMHTMHHKKNLCIYFPFIITFHSLTMIKRSEQLFPNMGLDNHTVFYYIIWDSVRDHTIKTQKF